MNNDTEENERKMRRGRAAFFTFISIFSRFSSISFTFTRRFVLVLGRFWRLSRAAVRRPYSYRIPQPTRLGPHSVHSSEKWAAILSTYIMLNIGVFRRFVMIVFFSHFWFQIQWYHRFHSPQFQRWLHRLLFGGKKS